MRERGISGLYWLHWFNGMGSQLIGEINQPEVLLDEQFHETGSGWLLGIFFMLVLNMGASLDKSPYRYFWNNKELILCFSLLLRQFTNASSPSLLKTGSQARLLENQVVSWWWPLWCFLKQDIEQEEEFLAQEMSHVPHKVRPSWWNCRRLIKVKFFMSDQL